MLSVFPQDCALTQHLLLKGGLSSHKLSSSIVQNTRAFTCDAKNVPDATIAVSGDELSSEGYGNEQHRLGEPERRLNNFYRQHLNYDIDSRGSTNVWNSPSLVAYTYGGRTYTGYLKWSDMPGATPTATARRHVVRNRRRCRLPPAGRAF